MGIGQVQAVQQASVVALTPDQVLAKVFQKNSELMSARSRFEAEESLVKKSYFLNDPVLGLMTETKDGEKMEFLTITQEIMFPGKYFAMGRAQKARARAAQSQYELQRLDTRMKALDLYFGYYSAVRTLILFEAQRETLKEIARIAESRRATGAVPQQDEMKAHVEQTMIENEILMQKQDVMSMGAELVALLNEDPDFEIRMPTEELKTPQLKMNVDEILKLSLEQSKALAVERAMYEEAEKEKSAAIMTYFPDFMLSYKKADASNYSYEVGITIPLWFFTKQTSDVAAASARLIAAEKKLDQEKRNIQGEVKSLSHKASTFFQMLKIYESSLIPQTTSALNSSRAAYSAGRVGFQELLDAERSLYAVRIEYYKNLTKYIQAVVELEKVLGVSVSQLPFETNY
jgi:cobalt-zinc-cadmium efflux system outer membrane protein